MFKTDILFTGFYGQQNTGDDAFVDVASWGASKFWKKENNRFLSMKSRLPITSVPVKGYPFNIKKTYSLQAKMLLNNTKAFIYAGGSTIYGEMSKNNIRLQAVNKKMLGADFKFGAIGVSIGPFQSIADEKAVQSYLKQMDFLAVRDRTSFDFVTSIKDLPYRPINAFDLAALLPNIYNECDYSLNVKTIGISVCPYETLDSKLDSSKEVKRNLMLVDLIKYLDKIEDISFKFFIINGNSKIGDLNLTKEIIELSQPKKYEILAYNNSVKDIWKSINSCDFVLSTRLHAAVFACFGNTPFMLNEYHRKCSDFLDNIEYNRKYRLYNSDYDIIEKAYQIVEIINCKEKYEGPIQISKMKKQAELNFTEIKI